MRPAAFAVSVCLPLVLALWSPAARAGGAVAVRQGFSPFGMALTQDGRYAYLSYDLSPFVTKVRLSDMTVVASADFSRYYPLQCSSIVLDAAETKLFLFDHTQGRLLVLDAATLQEMGLMTGFGTTGGVAQLVASRWCPYVIVVKGSVWLVNTEMLQTTALGNSVGFTYVQESATDAATWYGVASQPGSTSIGIYNYKTKQWSAKAALAAQSSDWGIHDFAVLPDGSKAYLGVLGSFLANYQATGWLWVVDLKTGAIQQQTIDGGAMSLTLSKNGRQLYVGAGWPALTANAGPLLRIVNTANDYRHHSSGTAEVRLEMHTGEQPETGSGEREPAVRNQLRRQLPVEGGSDHQAGGSQHGAE